MSRKDLESDPEFTFDHERYRQIDRTYVPLDRTQLRRTRNLRLIPEEGWRKGGKYSYAEWAHVIGIFQTLLYLQLQGRENVEILDVGCGTGLMGIASEPFLGDSGRYTGLDVKRNDIEFCRGHYPASRFEFVHLDVHNAVYAASQKSVRTRWPFGPARFDMVTALSVWTHLGEADALFYGAEIRRVLRPGGKAIVTCFLMDSLYEEGIASRTEEQGRFHMVPQNMWIFDQPVYGSDAWFHPSWANVCEQAIGITTEGIYRLAESAGLKLVQIYPGNWKEVPGVFFQDVVIFEAS